MSTAKLALEDGTIVTGVAIGAIGTRAGEVVFNTAITGYQEIFSDPSYCGQIVVMTFPLIGNYGVNEIDFESARPFLSGFVVRELPARPSNYRATASFDALLKKHNVVGIAGVDTRAITRRVRAHGALRGVISSEILDEVELVRRAAGAPSMAGANLVDCVAPEQSARWVRPLDRLEPAAIGPASADVHVVAIDCGIKHNILRHLVERGCRVTVIPAGASAAQIRDASPDGVLVGNGPGDPAAVAGTIAMLRELMGTVPIFGICLGHQMLGLALGAETYKLRFGHHGANVPVLNRPAGRVEITSQNHGFAVDEKSLTRVGGEVTHVNLNDHSVEGFIHEGKGVMAVQFHPEASPGPNDAAYLFARFVGAIRAGRPIAAGILSNEPAS